MHCILLLRLLACVINDGYYYLPDIAASAFDGISTDNAVTCFCDQTLHYNETPTVLGLAAVALAFMHYLKQ